MCTSRCSPAEKTRSLALLLPYTLAREHWLPMLFDTSEDSDWLRVTSHWCRPRCLNHWLAIDILPCRRIRPRGMMGITIFSWQTIYNHENTIFLNKLPYPRLCYIMRKIYTHFTKILWLNTNNYFIWEVSIENRPGIVSSVTVSTVHCFLGFLSSTFHFMNLSQRELCNVMVNFI